MAIRTYQNALSRLIQDSGPTAVRQRPKIELKFLLGLADMMKLQSREVSPISTELAFASFDTHQALFSLSASLLLSQVRLVTIIGVRVLALPGAVFGLPATQCSSAHRTHCHVIIVHADMDWVAPPISGNHSSFCHRFGCTISARIPALKWACSSVG